jgi:hypothetical protein
MQMADNEDSTPTNNIGVDSQITDSVTQGSVQAIGLGPATAAVNAYLGQSQAQSILFANMVNQQAQYANIAATTLTQELSQLFSLGDSE